MNIMVCVKQVPDTTEIKTDPVTNTLIREGVPSIVNTFDGYALETALRMKEMNPTIRIVVLSMGPAQAKEALKTCLSVGADKAYLVTDRAFGGSDTLATSYIISCAIRAVEKAEGTPFDLIFCGKQAIDGDTAQVGPEIAEHLGYPQITYAVEASAEVENVVRVKRETENGYEILEANTPVVVTMTKTAYDLRIAGLKGKMAASRADIPSLTAADFEVDTTCCGLKGSPTKVKKTYVPQRKAGGMKIKEETPEESASKLAALLAGAEII